MKTIYLECGAGASGDMITGALVGLLAHPKDYEKMISSAKIPGVEVTVGERQNSGITGIGVNVSIDGEKEGDPHGHHRHRSLTDVLGIIDGLNIGDNIKTDAKNIYVSIADAESKIHGRPVDLVHFHEVGALDAVADIVGVCLLFNILSPDRIIASPVRTGYGFVQCAHGKLPVPAPATSLLLKGVPVYAGDIEGEFCTPTGAAILRYFTDSYGTMPIMTLGNVGIGVGEKEFPIANVVRAYEGTGSEAPASVDEITCDLDDMSPEDIAPVIDILLKNGARDAFLRPCLMKKGRPGFELTCLCFSGEREKMIDLVLTNTTTIGVRAHRCDRYAMQSKSDVCETPYGTIRVKTSEGFGHKKIKPEFDDVSKAAETNGVPINTVREAVRNAK